MFICIIKMYYKNPALELTIYYSNFIIQQNFYRNPAYSVTVYLMLYKTSDITISTHYIPPEETVDLSRASKWQPRRPNPELWQQAVYCFLRCGPTQQTSPVLISILPDRFTYICRQISLGEHLHLGFPHKSKLTRPIKKETLGFLGGYLHLSALPLRCNFFIRNSPEFLK